MNSRYEQIEDSIVALLQGNPGFDAMSLPDNKAAMQHSGKCKVYVMYNNSDFSETENLGVITQEEKVFIGVHFKCLIRRGNTGLFAAQKIVWEKLIGYKMPGCDKMQLVSFVPLDGCGPGEWDYFATFSFTTHVAETIIEPDEPLFKSYSFVKE